MNKQFFPILSLLRDEAIFEIIPLDGGDFMVREACPEHYNVTLTAEQIAQWGRELVELACVPGWPPAEPPEQGWPPSVRPACADLVTMDESEYAAKCIEVYATITPEGIEDLWPPEIQRIIHEMHEIGERLKGNDSQQNQ